MGLGPLGRMGRKQGKKWTREGGWGEEAGLSGTKVKDGLMQSNRISKREELWAFGPLLGKFLL
jgi:hypothetical protein